MVELDHHAGLDHPLERVVGGHDHVIAGIAGLELGKQLVIVGIEIHLGLDAGRLLEVGKRVLADIGVPVVEIELLLFLGHGVPGQKGQPDRKRAGPLQKSATVRTITGSVYHVPSSHLIGREPRLPPVGIQPS